MTRFGAFHLNERPPQNLATATRPAEQDTAHVRAKQPYLSHVHRPI
ncbi:hypothetical protein [Psychrobacter sp. I-STPA10]|nr:hypothetical protein [Psychrobacter sp. I-STPA10]